MKKYIMPRIIIFSIIFTMSLTACNTNCSTNTFNDDELICTSDWCPIFVSVLHKYNDTGVFGTSVFYGDYLIAKRIAQVDILDLRYQKGISKLMGIEHFTGLEILQIHSYYLTDLSFFYNYNLRSIEIQAQNLTNLDVSNNFRLQILQIKNTSLTELDISNNENLRHFGLVYSALSVIDISKNVELRWVWFNNNYLTTLDVSSNKMLRWLDVSGNNIKSPDDVIGWEEIGLNLRAEKDGSEQGSFIFWPQNTTVKKWYLQCQVGTALLAYMEERYRLIQMLETQYER